MAKSYEVLHDTWLRGRRYASGSQAILSEEDAVGYAKAGLIKNEAPVVREEPKAEPAVEPHPEPVHKKKKHSAKD